MSAANKRVMALDFGDRTVGVALTDPLGIIATGLETIRRKDKDNLTGTIARLRSIIAEFGVAEVLLGLPKNMNNTEGPRCEATRRFGARLTKEFPDIPITLWDERLTTVEALSALKGASAAKRKEAVDTVAAVRILQNYMDFQIKNKNEVDSLGNNDQFNGDFDGDADDFDDMDGEYRIITLLDDDDEEINFAVLDEKEVNGVTYLLVLEEENIDDDEAEADILKAVPVEGEDDLVYEYVDDDKEFDFAASLFDDGNEDYEVE